MPAGNAAPIDRIGANEETVTIEGWAAGRVALVTGAAYGIGRGVAERLARDGFTLMVSAERDIEPTVRAVRAVGATASGDITDLRDFPAAGALVERTVREWGRIDVLVNNAGITLDQSIAGTTEDDVARLLSVNVAAALWSVRAAVPHMTAQGGGSVINMSSILSGMAGRNHALYSATKGAVDAMTRQFAFDLASAQIRVNAILPGLIEVDRSFDHPEYTTERAGTRVPWGRIGRPSDVAGLVSFLAGDDSEYISGQLIHVDGGLSVALCLHLNL